MLNLDVSTSNEWHLLKGEQQFGPYSYEHMLRMKQDNLLFDFDYVWSPHLPEWVLVGDLSEFSADRLTRLIEKSPESGVFHKRSSPRIAMDLGVLVHDDSRIWKGRLQTLSQGGALILIENPFLLPEDTINLHVRSSGRLKAPFNCRAVILNKRLLKSRIHHDTALHYAVKFTDLSEIGRTEILRLFEEISTHINTVSISNIKGE